MTDVGDRSVVFVHGLWLHADSWTPWVERFRAAGYSPSAPGWPGDAASVAEARRNPQTVAGYGIGDVVDHYARIISALGSKPIAIGHSFGGLIVQRLLAQDLAAAAVAIDPAPIKGVLYLPPSALRVASIALRNPANRKGTVALHREAVQVRVRQRPLGGRVEGSLRALDDRVARQAALRSGGRQPLAQLAGEGRHEERLARAAARHRGRQDHTVPKTSARRP